MFFTYILFVYLFKFYNSIWFYFNEFQLFSSLLLLFISFHFNCLLVCYIFVYLNNDFLYWKRSIFFFVFVFIFLHLFFICLVFYVNWYLFNVSTKKVPLNLFWRFIDFTRNHWMFLQSFPANSDSYLFTWSRSHFTCMRMKG